jgi:anti-sigma B factor antagonist
VFPAAERYRPRFCFGVAFDRYSSSPLAVTDMAERLPPISVEQFKEIRIVEFTYNKILDEGNITDIGQSLGTLVEEGSPPKLLLDFNNVDHLSSAALGMLIDINNKIRKKNGQLRLANIKPNIYEVFAITKLNQLFKILPGRNEALASFN